MQYIDFVKIYNEGYMEGNIYEDSDFLTEITETRRFARLVIYSPIVSTTNAFIRAFFAQMLIAHNYVILLMHPIIRNSIFHKFTSTDVCCYPWPIRLKCTKSGTFYAVLC